MSEYLFNGAFTILQTPIHSGYQQVILLSIHLPKNSSVYYKPWLFLWLVANSFSAQAVPNPSS